MQDQPSMFWLFIFGFFPRENNKLVKGNEVFCFIESHYNDFVHICFDSTELYIFKLVPNSLQGWNWKMVHYILAIQNFLNSLRNGNLAIWLR